MKSAIYNVSDHEDKRRFYLVVYDETMPCVLCGLPVLSASVSATAICGPCDCGKPRIPEWQMRRRSQTKVAPEEAWSNKTQDFLFDSRDQADLKMYELHQEGIEGWSHVILKFQDAANRTGASEAKKC